MPHVKRAEIGETLLGHIERVAGQTCSSPLGTRALDKLHRRALGAQVGGRIAVVPSGPELSIYLPGGLIVMNRDLIEDTQDPAVVGGHIIAAAAQVQQQDPLAALLRHSGISSTFALLTTGDLPPESLRSYAESLVAEAAPQADPAAMLPLFAAAQLPSTPYAYSIDITGETTLSLIEGDPMEDQDVLQVLTDGEWISLQGICG